jgi:hypothetical protein
MFLLLLDMVNRLYKLIALFFLLFSGYSAAGRGGLYHYYQKNQKNTSVSSAKPYHNPFSLEFVLNNVPAPVINVQQHRGAHSVHGFLANTFNYTIRIKYLDFVCNERSGQLSRFRKLILFPFHAFW